MAFVARVLRVRPGEGRITALMVGLAFVSTASLSIGESGISALFFEHVGADSLPYVYLLQGGTTFVVMLALTGTLARIGHRRAYLAAPLSLAAVLGAERAALASGADWIYTALWITVAIATLVVSIAVWGIAGMVVDTRQAKRLFPIFAAGGILGSVIGGLVTKPIAAALGATNLPLVWTGGLVVAFLVSRSILGPPPAGPPRRRTERRRSALGDLTSAFVFVRRSRLLVWMTVAAVLFSVLYYSLYLPYARAAAERFRDADDLAGFFGLFWAGVTGAAFVASMFGANRLIAWFGVAAMVIVLPVLYTGAFGVLLISSGFVTLVALRFVIGLWLQGVASPAWETLNNVIPESTRDQTRAFLNGGPTQVGTVIAGVVALVGENALTPRQFALIGLIAAIATTIATVAIRRSYAGALGDALRAGRPQVFEPSARSGPVPLDVDADAARVLEGALHSADMRERRLAYQAIADLPVDVRHDAVLDGVGDDDPIVRLAAVRALESSTSSGREALVSMIGDADAAVAAAAAVRALDLRDEPRSETRLAELLSNPDAATRHAATEQLALAPADRAATLAVERLSDPDEEVRAAALDVLADAAPSLVVDHALAAIGDPSPIVRRAAGRALGSAEGPAFDRVLAALEDQRTADGAIEAVRAMPKGDDRTQEFVRRLAAHSSADRELAASISDADEAGRLLRDAVLDRGRRVARAGLWGATLVARSRAEMETAIENLDGRPGQVANALETLESAAADPALVRPLIALWESPGTGHRSSGGLSRALDDEDEFIRRCAEHVRVAREGGRTMPEPVAAISIIERVLFLRKVTLFADLAPSDLERVARLAEERGYADSEVIAAEGELGEDLYIIVDGTIRVVKDREGSERELARRMAGDVVGEMSIITQTPRVATLVADGPVRTIRLRHREFESMLRERPTVAMGVMRVLAYRLAERGLESGE
ncbi:MAG TPA: Npt1/Npt2 family nucleotide transporter [Actinomycetota bacterium]|jgi:HEAT repeat protein|nr:Npt1/Npt2 family nucleotide transporter [Actinomycetota bacterium]